MDFLERETQRFCKAYISDIPKSYMIDNNVAETFNAYIVKARTKHTIDMLEEIRVSIMEIIHEKHEEIKNMRSRICPRIMQNLELTRYYSRNCICKPVVGGRYQIVTRDDGYVVDLDDKTCTCREWQITGITCIHACTAIHFMHYNPADYVHRYYTVDKHMQAYQHGIQPLNGRRMWPLNDGEPIKPPPYRKMPGRPKKMRKRGLDEDPRRPNKLSKQGIQITCSVCGVVGHNKLGCNKKDDPTFQRPEK
ncbi:hypothetical protein ACS0TY_003046 [Phlomoides rotata]